MMMNRPSIFLACALGIAVSSADPANHGDREVLGLLRLIPASLPVTIVVVDSAKLDQEIGAFLKRLDTDDPSFSILDSVRKDLPIRDWIDFSRPFGLAAIDRNGESEVRVYWGQVPDLESKLKAVPRTSQDDHGVWTLDFGPEDEWSLKPVGEYVVASPSNSALRRALEGERGLADLAGELAGILTGRHVFLRFSIDQLRDRALTGISESTSLVPLVAIMAAQQGEADAAIMAAFLSTFLDAAKGFVEQAEAIELTLGIDSSSADLTMTAVFHAGPIEEYLAGQQPDKRTPWSHVADQPYLMAMSFGFGSSDSPIVEYLVDRVAQHLMSPAAAEPDTFVPAPTVKVDTASIEQAAQMTRDLYGAITGADAVMALGADGIRFAADYFGQDPRVIHRLTTDALTSGNPLLARVKGGTRYEHVGVRRIGETNVEEFLLRMNPAHPTSRFYGPEARFGLGLIGDRLRAGMGSEKDIEAAFTAEVRQPLASSPLVQASVAALPKRRNLIILIDPSAALPILGPMLGKTDIPALPPGPPLAISISLCDEPARLDVHVPLRSIERIVQAIAPQKPM